MSTTTAPTEQKTGDGAKMLKAMVGIGVLCGLLIVVTYESALPRINRLKAEAFEKAIFRVLPDVLQTQAFELLPDSTFRQVDVENPGQNLVYAGYDANDRLRGIAIAATGQGYADKISVLYGYEPVSETIHGFYVLESKETPGLGDKIEKDEQFLANFKALNVSLDMESYTIIHPIVTVKSGQKQNPWEIDGITGATISSRAIGDLLAASTADMIPLIQRNLSVFQQNTKSQKNE